MSPNVGTHGRIARRLALAGLAVAAVLPTLATTPAPAQVGEEVGVTLWRGNSEEGDLSDWERNGCGGNFSNPPNADAVISTRAHAGSYGARLFITDPNGPSAQGARLFRWCEPRDHPVLRYTAWYYVPRTYDIDRWFHIMQWKSTMVGGCTNQCNATVAVNVRTKANGAMALGIERGVDNGGGTWTQNAAEVPIGRWFEVEAKVWKGSDSDGRIRLWQDGTLLLDVQGINTARSDDLQWAVIAYGQGISPEPVTVYADDARIATP